MKMCPDFASLRLFWSPEAATATEKKKKEKKKTQSRSTSSCKWDSTTVRAEVWASHTEVNHIPGRREWFNVYSTAPSFKSDIPLLPSLCCHHSQTNLRKLLCILLKPAKGGRRQFLSNAHTLSQKPNCSCQNIVCALDTGVGTYSLSCYTLHKHPCSEWVTNCVPSSPFSARQPCAVPTLVSDTGYLIGELTALCLFAVHVAAVSDLGQTLFVNKTFFSSWSTWQVEFTVARRFSHPKIPPYCFQYAGEVHACKAGPQMKKPTRGDVTAISRPVPSSPGSTLSKRTGSI